MTWRGVGWEATKFAKVADHGLVHPPGYEPMLASNVRIIAPARYGYQASSTVGG